MIKGLVVGIVQILIKIVMMYVLIENVSARYGMILSRHRGTSITI
jgi:hypothetical protein